MLSLALLTPFVLPPTPPPDEIEAALDALIERTNELTSFTARYEIVSSDGGTGTLALEFAGPDRARLELHAEEFGGVANTWLVDGEFCMVAGEGEEQTYARIEMPRTEPAAMQLLRELFPPADGAADQLAPGPTFVWSIGHDEASDRATLDVTLMHSSGPRASLLRWLREWRSRTELVELTDDALVMTHERFGGTIPLDTGFPSELWLIGKDGEERRIELTSLALDEPADDARFEIPARPKDATDESEELGRAFQGLSGARATRSACLARIDGALGAGRAEWNEASREDARAVFRALHEAWLTEVAQQATESLSTWIESYADWVEEQLGAGRAKEDVRAHVAATWSELERRNAQALEGWLEALTQHELQGIRSVHYEALIALEAEEFEALYAEHVAAPARKLFDEATSAVLDDREALKMCCGTVASTHSF